MKNLKTGTIVMFIGFTLVVVGLFYKPEAEKMKEKCRHAMLEVKQKE